MVYYTVLYVSEEIRRPRSIIEESTTKFVLCKCCHIFREPRDRTLSHLNMINGRGFDHKFVDFLEDGNVAEVDEWIMGFLESKVANHYHFQTDFIMGEKTAYSQEDLNSVCDILSKTYFAGIVEHYETSLCLYHELTGVPPQDQSVLHYQMRDGGHIPGSHIAYQDKELMSSVIRNYTAREDSYTYDCA